VANEDDNKVSFLELGSGRVVHEVEVGAEPEGMAISPDGRTLVCTSETASLAHFIDTGQARLLGSELVGTRPRDAHFTRDGAKVWVSSETRGSVSLLDVGTRRLLATVDLDPYAEGDQPMQAVGMASTPAGDRLFVALGRANRVAEIDAATLKPVRFHRVGERNWGVALDGAARRLYASNGLSGDVTVIDVVANAVEARIATAGKPWGVVVAP
jgi:YVTN family beta-propeller protein